MKSVIYTTLLGAVLSFSQPGLGKDEDSLFETQPPQSAPPSTPSSTTKQLSAPVNQGVPEDTITSRWYFGLGMNIALLGPVTYDRLGVYSKTGIAKRDPNLYSVVLSGWFDQIGEYGGLFLSPFFRWFRPITNNVKGTYTDESQGYSQSTTVSSSGGGLEAGWTFRNRDDFRNHWFPSFGVVFEKNAVHVKGTEVSDGVNNTPPGETTIDLASTLTGAYLRAALDYRMKSQKPEIVFCWTFEAPIWSSLSAPENNIVETDLASKLYHRLQGSTSLGFRAALDP